MYFYNYFSCISFRIVRLFWYLFSLSAAAFFHAFLTPHHFTRWLDSSSSFG